MDRKTYLVEFTKFAAKQTQRLPLSIREAVFLWRESVEHLGLPEVRKSRGYHDEPLRGERRGQRSIRLSRSYRLIYVESARKEIIVVGILEVSKHDY